MFRYASVGRYKELLLTPFRWRVFPSITIFTFENEKGEIVVAMCEQNHSCWVFGRHTGVEIHGVRQTGMQLQPRGERTMEGYGRRRSGARAMVSHCFVRAVGGDLCGIPG